MKKTVLSWMRKLLALGIGIILTGAAIPNRIDGNAIAQTNMLSSSNVQNVDTELYYYSQLTDIEKKIYDNLVDSKEKFMKNENVDFIIEHYEKRTDEIVTYYKNAISRAKLAFVQDNPDVQIWIKKLDTFLILWKHDIRMHLEPNEKTKRYSDIKPEYLDKAINKLEQKTSNFVKTLSGTDYQKLRQIHDWLIQIAEYDYEFKLPNTNNAYGTIVEGHAICSGFASAYKYVADMAGLKVLYVSGEIYDPATKSMVLHAWNIAYADGKWFIVDVTFDETLGKTVYFGIKTDSKTYKMDKNLFRLP